MISNKHPILYFILKINLLIKKKIIILPFEQIISGHGSSSRSDPIHILPLFLGSGFVQIRVRDRNVLLQTCGHLLQELHGDQPP